MTNAYNLEEFMIILDSWGLRDVLLPFLLIFTIFYAILHKSNVLGAEKKNMNVVVSLVVGLMVVIPHVLDTYPPGADIVEIMNSAIPHVSIVVIGVVMMLILIGLFGGEAKWMGSSVSGWIAILSFALIIFIFGASADWWSGGNWLDDLFGSDAMALIIIILVFGVLVWFITSGDKDDSKSSASFAENVRDLFGGKN